MQLEDYIGYPKNELLKMLDAEKISYEIVDFNENKDFDTELFVKFEYINSKLIIYFDKFKFNI